MKKISKILAVGLLTFTLTSCGSSDKKRQKVMDTFNSLKYTDAYIIQTNGLLFVGENIIKTSNIKYEDQKCEIITLEKDGFYSYAYNAEETMINLVYMDYDLNNVELIDSIETPYRINHAFRNNDCFYFKTIHYDYGYSKRYYITYNASTKEKSFIYDEDLGFDEYAIDNNRIKDYEYEFHENRSFGKDSIDITDKNTNITKKVDMSVLSTFEDGKKIEKCAKMSISSRFDIENIFEKDGDFYILNRYVYGGFQYTVFNYILKWNFETEKTEVYTAIAFPGYQTTAKDFYIL
ncbi:MAG: hypothetical protein J1F31_00215 [Erysipelotrichales bacterium]|nr:hypothetical protein [Erysipelotrichales bacterium]